ncbi:MAG: phosphatidate cytidylyltransferase [Candidatus Eisenbacteria bacterium]|uniref:Phosphatidate cytidylyltransferase n=1 Tax=Eiseniibacteriota bacterium TaxID=2212470 RepID=A0A937XCF0_UNCEI|nr:phosphatidate cytidylyltransferase [Candidatus Eisenbacteria bacterium]
MRWFGEIGRKALHVAAISIPVGYYFVEPAYGRGILATLTAISFVIDVVRLNQPRVRTFFYIFFGRLVRDHERHNLLGATYLLLSSLICVHAFSKPVAVAALAFLILGDTVAALVGRAFGRVRIFGKTLEGSLACLAVCVLIGALIPELGWTRTLVGAATATLIELVPVPLDDNLRIPLAAGFMMQLVP